MAKNDTPEIPGLFDDLPEEVPQEQIGKISLRNWRAHLASIRTLDKQIERLIDDAVKQALAQGKKLTSDDVGRLFQRHPELRIALDNTMEKLNADLTATIEQGSKEAWLRANTAADEVVATMAANNEQLASLLNDRKNQPQNDRALRAFQQREMQGMKLSDRVWKSTEGMKLDMERAIEVSLAEGVPAQELSERVRELLKEPHRLYRRVRDKQGNLRLSQAAQKYHPGTGVYRSSYKNAMRLARTEVNMAYQASDSERWTKSWWVKGIRVSLSNNHTCLNSKGRPAPLVDICDELAGNYPADFKFTGWHPQCRCFATAITCDYADIRDYYQRKRAGEDMTGYTPPGAITDPPEQFKRWMADNSDRLAGAARRGSTPYFITNNAKYTQKKHSALHVFNPKVLTEEEFVAYSKQMNISKEEWEEIYDGEDVYINSSWSRKINENLSKEKIGDKVPEDFMGSDSYRQITTLDSVINKNQLDEDLLLYRKVSKEWLTREGVSFNEGSIVHEYGFTSTSAVKGNNVINKTRNVTLEIIAPKGSKAYITENIRESEIILPRNSEFKVISVNDNNGNPIIRLQLINTREQALIPRSKTPLEIADERHARRTAEDELKIRKRWDLHKEANRLRSTSQYIEVRVNYDNGGLMATHIGHNFDKKKGWYEKRVQQIGFDNGHTVILENERDGKFHQKFTEGKWDDRLFEIATRETGTANNILRGLKHCADKPKTEIAVLYFPKGFNKDNLANALYRYKSFERHPERTFVKFKRVVCITDEGIVYDQPL